jgi:predicted acylesterase/phospholipase RssA
MADPAPQTAAPEIRVSDDPGSLRQRIVDLLEYLYGPMIVSVGFFFLYAFADPAQEALFGIATDFATLRAGLGEGAAGMQWVILVRAGYGLFAPLLMTYALWVAARFVLQIYTVAPSRERDAMLVAVPLLPSLAMVIGPVRAALAPEAKASAESLGLPGGILAAGDLRAELLYLAIPGVFGCLLIAIYFIARWDEARGGATAARVRVWLERVLDLDFPLARALGVIGVLAIAAVAILGIANMRFGEWAGPIGVSASFAAALGLLLAGLTAASRLMPGRFPLLVVVLLLALGLSSPWLALAILAGALVTLAYWRRLTGWGRAFALGLAAVQGAYIAGGWLSDGCDTLAGCNMVQPLQGAPFDFSEDGTVVASTRAFRSDVASPSASLGFSLWNQRRLALEARDGTPRPIRVVSAQGGGLYAAYQTAWYLAHRADTEPGFAASVFAISGVSGGSVGGGVFWAIRASGVCDRPNAGDDCHQRGVRAILEHDYLSPALTGLFFRDAIDSVIPISALFAQPIDRGRALENALADRLADWIRAETGRPPANNPMHLAMSRSWSPDAGLPLLLMNATDVASGGLTVLSPVRDVTLNVPGRLRLPGAGDLRVASAVVTSARFPLVSPPLRVRVAEPVPGRPGEVRTVTRQLVDGGYFDNSGLETLTDLLPLMTLRRARAEPGSRAPIEVIVFTVAEAPFTEPPAMKGTLAAPMAAFTGAWRSRRDLTVRRIEAAFQAADAGVCFVPARMSEDRVNFTVSWFLSTGTFAAIREEMARKAAERGTCPPA